MSKPIAYLAGPIKGCTEQQSTSWRDDVTEHLWEHGIRALSPLRAKEALWELTRRVGEADSYAHLGPFFTTRGIMMRDFTDVKRSDLLLVNLMCQPEGEPSLGTTMELGWAFAFQKPVVVAIQPDNELFQHPLLREAMGGLVFDNLDDAVHAAVVVLNG